MEREAFLGGTQLAPISARNVARPGAGLGAGSPTSLLTVGKFLGPLNS